MNGSHLKGYDYPLKEIIFFLKTKILFPGDIILRSTMAVEKLGSWQAHRPAYGPRYWGRLRG